MLQCLTCLDGKLVSMLLRDSGPRVAPASTRPSLRQRRFLNGMQCKKLMTYDEDKPR
jgi:hypothetical protein